MRGPAAIPRRSATLFVLAVSTAALLAQDQPSRPSFKAAVGLVQIDVSVLDGKRQPIRGLQASDFTVLEDGKPRPIRVFEAIDLPPRAPQVDAALAGDAGSSVATNQVGNEDGRLVFILMDRTIPFGQPVIAAKHRHAAINALDRRLAAIVTTAARATDTDADRARLLRAVTRRLEHDHQPRAAGDRRQVRPVQRRTLPVWPVRARDGHEHRRRRA